MTVEEMQTTLEAAGFLLPGTYTPGTWGRICEGAAGDLLREATTSARTPADVVAARTTASGAGLGTSPSPATTDDTEAERMLRSLGI